jgi:DNA-binding NtrC family response regulator
MASEQQKAVATAQMESLLVSDDRQRMAARLTQWLRDAGYNCEVLGTADLKTNQLAAPAASPY